MARTIRAKLRNRALIAMLILIILGLGTGVIGMMRAGLVKGSYYRQKAEAEQLSDSKINAHRGTIYDKNGNILATSADAFKVIINPSEIREEKIDPMVLSNQLAQILNMDPNEIYEKTQKLSLIHI